LRKIPLGMVGGGRGAGIANVHRAAIRLDGRFELVAGVFSRDDSISRDMGRELGIDPERLYVTPAEMAVAESKRNDGISVVSIVTPQYSHYEAASSFLDNGIHVVCDKPLTGDLGRAEALARLTRERGLIFALTHCYSAYSMVRHARHIAASGALGSITMAQVEHASGWAASLVEETGRKGAAWRTDPGIAGKAGVVYDLGTHAHHLLRFVTGLEVEELAAEMSTAVEGRRVFDNAQVLLRLSNGGRATLWATMAATGNEHGLRIRVFGTKASLEWSHEDAQHLAVKRLDGRREVVAHAMANLSPAVDAVKRVGFGHPEGFIEAFGNIYREVADRIASGDHSSAQYPTVDDGLAGESFVDSVIRSAQDGGRWTPVKSFTV